MLKALKANKGILPLVGSELWEDGLVVEGHISICTKLVSAGIVRTEALYWRRPKPLVRHYVLHRMSCRRSSFVVFFGAGYSAKMTESCWNPNSSPSTSPWNTGKFVGQELYHWGVGLIFFDRLSWVADLETLQWKVVKGNGMALPFVRDLSQDQEVWEPTLFPLWFDTQICSDQVKGVLTLQQSFSLLIYFHRGSSGCCSEPPRSHAIRAWGGL